jgi:hypothetical protein
MVILIDYHSRGRLLAKVLRYLSEINKTDHELNSTLVALVGQWGCQYATPSRAPRLLSCGSFS